MEGNKAEELLKTIIGSLNITEDGDYICIASKCVGALNTQRNKKGELEVINNPVYVALKEALDMVYANE